MPVPEVVHLLLVAYGSTAEGGRAVSDIIAAGILPAAIEMMDALSIEAAEEAVHCNYPAGAGAVLLVELDGPAAEVEAELATVRGNCPVRSWTPAWSTAARSPASTASAWTNPGTCRKCSAPMTWTPCSCSGARSTRPACATRARSSLPPGCAARYRATGARYTRP